MHGVERKSVYESLIKLSSNCFLFYVLYKLFKSMVLRKRSES